MRDYRDARMSEMQQIRFQRGEHVQLREIPGLVARVVTDLYACTPPMVQISFGGYMGSPVCVETARLERIVFDVQEQDWRRG